MSVTLMTCVPWRGSTRFTDTLMPSCGENQIFHDGNRALIPDSTRIERPRLPRAYRLHAIDRRLAEVFACQGAIAILLCAHRLSHGGSRSNVVFECAYVRVGPAKVFGTGRWIANLDPLQIGLVL